MHLSSRLFSLIGCLLILLSTACDPCDDPGTTEIDRQDNTPPILTWEVTVLSQTPSGPASSIALLSDAQNDVTIAADEELTLRLLAEDPQSGIQWIDLQGGFGYICNSGNGAIALDGIVPGDPVQFNHAEDCCAQVEGAYPAFTIVAADLCPETFPTLTSGGYAFDGTAENGNGLTGESTLLINLVPTDN